MQVSGNAFLQAEVAAGVNGCSALRSSIIAYVHQPGVHQKTTFSFRHELFDSGNRVVVEGGVPNLLFEAVFLDHSDELFFNAFIFKNAGFQLDVGDKLRGFQPVEVFAHCRNGLAREEALDIYADGKHFELF